MSWQERRAARRTAYQGRPLCQMCGQVHLVRPERVLLGICYRCEGERKRRPASPSLAGPSLDEKQVRPSLQQDRHNRSLGIKQAYEKRPLCQLCGEIHLLHADRVLLGICAGCETELRKQGYTWPLEEK